MKHKYQLEWFVGIFWDIFVFLAISHPLQNIFGVKNVEQFHFFVVVVVVVVVRMVFFVCTFSSQFLLYISLQFICYAVSFSDMKQPRHKAEEMTNCPGSFNVTEFSLHFFYFLYVGCRIFLFDLDDDDAFQ